jgi:hypothetical protein
MNKTGGRRKMFVSTANAASVIEQLLSIFSSPFFGEKLLYDYGFWLCYGNAE